MEYIYNIGSTDSQQYNYYRLELKLEETAVSNPDNTSTVAYRLRLYAGARYFYGYGLGAQILINGIAVASRDRETAPAVSIEKNGYLDILQGEATLSHNPDGTLTAPVEFSIAMTAGYYTPGSMQGTGELVLTDIPRLSQVRATSANIEEVAMLAITRHSQDFTHSVKYTFGSEVGYLTADGQVCQQEVIFDALSLGFLLPESFYSQIPHAPGGICQLEIATYAGAVCIGRSQTLFTITASPVLAGPQVEFTAADCNPETCAVTGDDKILVRGKSIVRCSVDARGQKGAEVVSVLVNGSPEMEFTPQTGLLECLVTDSRGYTARKTLTLSVIDYEMLTCNVSAQRVNPTDGQVRLQVWGQYFAGDFGQQENSLHLTCGAVEIPVAIADNTYRGEVILTDLSYQSAHTLEVVASDLLSRVSRTATVNRGVPVFDWGQSDFAFHVPVTVDGSINGVHMGAFSGSLWLTPDKLPQSFLVAGDQLLGTLTVTETDCLWQGTEGVTPLKGENRAGLLFSGETRGILLSADPWQA